MRKVIFFMLTSLDGYFEGPNREIDWHNVDEEFNRLSIEQLNAVDMLLFGRVTYEMMASYWPTPTAIQNDPIVAGKMNSLPKIVFSKTLASAKWQNTRLVKTKFVDEITKLKTQPGKDLIIFGSSDLAVSFLQHGLLDEIRVMVNPLILGAGKPVFKGIQGRLKLKLLNTKTLGNGNVVLYYQPDGKSQGGSR
jgi:dihydrofolate reductase